MRVPETVMNTGGQITDSIRPYPAMASPGRRAGYGLLRVRSMAYSTALGETGRQAAYCKHTAPGSPNNANVNMRFIVPTLLKGHGRITWSTEYKVS